MVDIGIGRQCHDLCDKGESSCTTVAGPESEQAEAEISARPCTSDLVRDFECKLIVNSSRNPT